MQLSVQKHDIQFAIKHILLNYYFLHLSATLFKMASRLFETCKCI